MQVGAVAFDFNGTLSDDEPVLARVYEELLTELGRPLTPDEYYEHLAGHTDEELFKRWLGHSSPELIAERVRRYNERVVDGSTVDADVRAAVRWAAERLPLAVVSAALRDEIEPVLRSSGLRDAFSVVLSQDDVTRGKPDPQPYLLAAERLAIDPEELLVFEDTAVGVASAKAAGAHVVGLTRTLGAERMSQADALVDRIDIATLEGLLCS
ncbi:MAG TPA: HAD family phosphatase [Gaiellaceae bacterium]|nr:HAD family phosphatase [Gaiellaceae bacterium]